MMYSLNEIGLLPSSELSEINHRSDVNPFYSDGKLPLFVAPMTCILDKTNIETFSRSKVIPIYPVRFDDDSSVRIDRSILNWTAMSLEDFEECFIKNASEIKCPELSFKVLIDCANGHMKRIYDDVRKAKSIFSNMKVMIGNIAHPDMYIECCRAGVDYVRVGIGGGYGCSTSCQTGVHASHVWLLEGIREIRQYMDSVSYQCNTRTKIIADGGIDTVDKAIKCLALGADYAMMGHAFAHCKEACGKLIDKYSREYYGQASEKGQIDRFGKVQGNPEGVVRSVLIKYSLDEYCSKFEAALRSAMSYVGVTNLEDFKTKVQYEIMSAGEFKEYYKEY